MLKQKYKITIFIIILMFLFNTNIFSQSNVSENNNKGNQTKNKVINKDKTKNDNETKNNLKVNIYYFADNSKTDKYRYFSFILPNSVKNELNKNYNVEAIVVPVTFKYIEPVLSEKEKKKLPTNCSY